MGVSFKDLVTSKEIAAKDLTGKVVAIDTFNMLYQFITTIRQRDGTPLKDSKGNITSHITGLFFRTAFLLQNNIKPVFIFDGKAPDLKLKERERREKIKEQAQEKFDEAEKAEDIDAMKKYASRVSRLTPQMIKEAKELITLLGLPYIDAPSEGDAQAAYLVKNGDAYVTISQDYDTLMHGSPRLVKNLNVAGRRKRGSTFATIKPEMIKLDEVLNNLGIDNDKLIMMGILIGTDYNIGGIKGIGPKKALKMIKESTPKEIFGDYDWKLIFDTIKDMPVTDDYELKWNPPDQKGILEMLTRFEFSRERIDNTLSKLGKNEQKGLTDFF